jgi:hypothetical protein
VKKVPHGNSRNYKLLVTLHPPWTGMEVYLQQCSSCDPAKLFFTSKFSYIYSFATPPIKLKLGQQIGGELLIANHFDQSI